MKEHGNTCVRRPLSQTHSMDEEWILVIGENNFGHHNMYRYIGPLQCLIFERGYGWSFTIRYFLLDGRYLQWSASKHEYWINPKCTEKPCLEAAAQFQRLLDLIKAPEPSYADHQNP